MRGRPARIRELHFGCEKLEFDSLEPRSGEARQSKKRRLRTWSQSVATCAGDNYPANNREARVEKPPTSGIQCFTMSGSADIWLCAMTNAPEPSISLGAARMRLHRKRRREGLRCLTILLRETKIEALIYWGYLKPEMRDSKNAILNALNAHFDRALVI
jgi:hypothetical protein